MISQIDFAGKFKTLLFFHIFFSAVSINFQEIAAKVPMQQ